MSAENKLPQALVIGAGIAGIKSALELAEAGVIVHICDQSTDIGGALFQMERWFPDDHCGLCQTLPVFDRGLPSQFCLRRGFQHPNIVFHLNSTVNKVEGASGNFHVTLNTKPLIIDKSLCTGCGLCAESCPVSPDASGHKAAYISSPQSLRKTYIIDAGRCTGCGKCTAACPAGAIDFKRETKSFEINAGAIIVSTGFEEFDPESASQYGYRRYPNVITGFDLEHMLGGNSPSSGKIVRPSDSKAPASVAFIQCAGSRDRLNDFCSSTCCMYAVREAAMIKDLQPGINVEICCIDMRCFGKGHQRYIDEAVNKKGIIISRGRVPVIKQDFSTGNLLISRLDKNGRIVPSVFEMAVLSASQRPSTGFKELSRILDIDINKWGFAVNDIMSPVASREGIFTCGSASGPRDIAESVAAASAAAGMALTILKPQKVFHVEAPAPAAQAISSVFICNCSGQISRNIDLIRLKEFTGKLPGVTAVHEFDRLCSAEQIASMKETAKKDGANALIIAACSIFRPLEELEGKPSIPVNIREELIWPHADPDAVIIKAEKILAMAVENARWRSPESSATGKVAQKAVVIGAGIAGLQCALTIAERGFEVELIEKSESAGGHAAHIYSLLGGHDPRTYLNELIDRVKKDTLIHLHTRSEISRVSGYAGNFDCTFTNAAAEKVIVKAGAIVVATGAGESTPSIYSYGKSKSIITQKEFEELAAGDGNKLSSIKSVVMIQCVGSRDKHRPYCSRICCSQAVKNALALKSKYPEINVTILYRDMMTYGFQEEFYTLAREKGVLFLRHDEEHMPAVSIIDGKLEVKAYDTSLNSTVTLSPDMLVLSAGITPQDSNKVLSGLLGIELNDDCFFKEIEPKFQPVDSTREGIFICGMASAPMSMPESVMQARAAGHRAASLLNYTEIRPIRTISEVNERRCTGCGLCIKACPYNARVRDDNRRVAVVIKELCRGCGACASVCPNGAAAQREFTSKQVFSLLDIAIGD